MTNTKPIEEINECSGCWFYEKYLRDKTVYVGDGPCERCEKYRGPKVTWG